MCVENMDWSNDIRFNSKKSVVIIFRNSFAKDFSFPSFVMNGESINEVPFVKYIGHVINDDMKDDLDVMRQCKQLYIHKALLQPSTLSSWSHWPRGPVDLKSYWPPGKSTGPHFPPTDVYIRD